VGDKFTSSAANQIRIPDDPFLCPRCGGRLFREHGTVHECITCGLMFSFSVIGIVPSPDFSLPEAEESR
jgi:predicted RNA-binding Zn-ribbon protein involved in translation (DUF1610 family)